MSKRHGLLGLVAVVLVGVVACGNGRPSTNDPNNNNNNNNNSGVATCAVGDIDVVTPDIDATLASGGAPDLSCVGAPRTVGAGQNATVEGCVDVFGVGNDAKRGTEVKIFAANVDPSSGTPIASGTVAVRNDASTLQCDAGDENAPACLAFGCGSKGYYRLDAPVPTHVPLNMTVKHPTDSTVIDTYIYGLFFFNEEIGDGVVNYEAPMIFRSTWDSIPTLGGRQITGGQDVTDGVGRAVIAGEIHDCNDVIIEGASVSIPALDSTMSIAYFDGDPEDPSPDLRRITTASDGLYTVLNATTDAGANEHVVAAGIREAGCTGDDCTCQSAGSRTIKTFPDSVTIVTLSGDFPVQ
jgi:hypothetical protein